MWDRVPGLFLWGIATAMLVGNAVAASSYPDPTRVLVVYKTNDVDTDGDGTGDSLELAQYYAVRRNVPPANLLGLNISVSSYYYYTGQYGLFYSDIVAPIKAKLASLGTQNVDVILLAGALPTVVYDGSNTVLSVDNALMGINVLGSASNSLIPRGSNPYFAVNPGFSADIGHFNHAAFQYMGTDMYLVTHLGSAASLRGIDKVAQSVYADTYLDPHPGYYSGTTYVDSQWGMPNGQPYTDAYLSSQMAVQAGDFYTATNTDLNIAYTEHWVNAAGFPLKWENTTHTLRIGDPGAMFSDGTSALNAPRALFYGGWYNFDHYNDVYQWLPGSIACDLNSASYFGTQALLHGASAAAYVVSEPYTNGHQRPDILYYYILQGYDFAEASALATPFIGWMAVNEGDPLYAPNQSKTPVVDTRAPVLKAGYPQMTVNPATGIATVNLPIDDTQAPEVVTAAVNYGPSMSYGSAVNSAPGFSRAPSVSLPSTAGRTYHYQVTLTDAVGNTWTSGDFTYAGNASPTIASSAVTAPNPVTGTAAAVTVLGADDGGESTLAYTWSATGPASVAFGTNGTNASKNTTATFARAGVYSLRAVITDSFGSTVTSTASVTVRQTASRVVVAPSSASVSIGGTRQFTASINDQFGNPITGAPVTWSVTAGGSISSSGLFTAGGAIGGPFTVSAASGSLIGTSSVTVTGADTTPPTVPANVSASAVSSSAINVGWSASTDNVGVAGYRVYRNGAQVGTPVSTSFADAGLAPNTTYSYTVSAYDAGGNVSAPSASAFGTTQGGLATALMIAGEPAELGLPAGTGSAATNNLSISPSINPYGLTGTLRALGTGSANFTPAQTGNGVYFTNCCSNANDAYYKFTGSAVGRIFHSGQGQISFSLRSRYSFAQRQASAGSPRYTFDVRDGTGHHPFSFLTQVTSGSLQFTYLADGGSQYYFVPKGTEDALFGSGVILNATLTWNGSLLNLYLNGVLVKSSPYTIVAPNWTAASNFDLGAYEYFASGGYSVCDDVVDQFTVLAPQGSTDTTPPVVSLTAPASGTAVSGSVNISANATDNVGVAAVQFKLDGINLGPALTGPGPSYSQSWDTTTVSNGAHTLTAVASDAAGNMATGVVSITANNSLVPPAISGVTASAITTSGATIIWATNKPATSQLAYGAALPYTSATSLNSTMVTSHSVNLSGLAPATVYHYQVLSQDPQGDLATSADFTFTTANAASGAILLIHADAYEVAGVTNGAIVAPTIAPAGFAGTVVVNGTGSVNYTPAATGNGVYFLNCCSNTNNAYYKFPGAAVGNVFGLTQDQITFSLKSRYTFSQRTASASSPRYAFDVRDGNGHQFYFLTQIVSGYLEFSYAAAGATAFYYVPKGTEDTLFGSGVILTVTLSWNGGVQKLFLNNVLVKSTSYTQPLYNWSATSNFDLGAYEYYTSGGYYVTDDIVDEFTVIPVASK